MTKKKETEKAGAITQTVLISALTTIFGIVLGYFGTMENAKAQIRTAEINIYGPMYATQTAEARITPVANPAQPDVTSVAASGILVPITNIQVDGKFIGDSYQAGNFRTGEFELTSKQGENGYTIPVDHLEFFWDSPGRYPELHNLPMRGIQATIKFTPSESLYTQELIMCHYNLLFDEHSYNGMEHYIPVDQPVTLVWDFAGRVFLTGFDFSDDETSMIDEAAERVNAKSSFTYYAKRNGELWQWQKLAFDVYEPDKVQQVSISCNVSAAEDYRGKASGRQFIFKGTVMLGDVIVFPYEQP
jgi:hypothetical protein